LVKQRKILISGQVVSTNKKTKTENIIMAATNTAEANTTKASNTKNEENSMKAIAKNDDVKQGEVVEPSRLDKVVDKITNHMKNTVENYVEVGRLLNNEKNSHKRTLKELYNRLGLSKSRAERFMKIASDSRLYNESNVQILPASWSTLFVISGMDDDEFQAAIDDGTINPSVTRNQMITYRRELAGTESKKEKLPLSFSIFANVEQMSVKDVESMESEIQQVVEKYDNVSYKAAGIVNKRLENPEHTKESENEITSQAKKEVEAILVETNPEGTAEGFMEAYTMSLSLFLGLHPIAQVKVLGGDAEKYGVPKNIASLPAGRMSAELTQEQR